MASSNEAAALHSKLRVVQLPAEGAAPRTGTTVEAVDQAGPAEPGDTRRLHGIEVM